jgi:hypothetical protein
VAVTKKRPLSGRTALIREGKRLRCVMLGDAAAGRQGTSPSTIFASHLKWPNDLALKRRFAVAALIAGQESEGLQAWTKLIEQHADDERIRWGWPCWSCRAFGDSRSKAWSAIGCGCIATDAYQSWWSLHGYDRCVARSRSSQTLKTHYPS